MKAYISNLGQVYYKSYTISASPRKIYYTQYFEGIAVPSSYSSSDGGATFSPLVVDAGRPNMPVFAIASSQRRLYASTDQGLYISDNEGASFTTRKNWSSPNCTYPWWNLAGYANLQVSASGNSILAGILPNGDLPLSIDNGQTFSFSRQVTLPAEFRNRKIFLDGPDVVFMGAELSGAKRIGFSKSTNGGVSWSDFAPSYNMTGTSKILYPLDKKPLNLDGGLYTAADGINLLGWVSAANLPDVLSAYSSDNRLITTNHNGYNIYENGSLKRAISSLEASSNATEFGSSQIIDLPSGPFYLGKRVFANDPGNPNFFKQVLTAPSMPMTIFENSTGIYVVTGLGGYYLYRSVDGGKTFAPVIGALN